MYQPGVQKVLIQNHLTGDIDKRDSHPHRDAMTPDGGLQ